jgi:hypothetical protein
VDGDRPALELTAAGQAEHERLVAAIRAGLGDLLQGWDPEAHPEVRQMLDRLSHAYASELPEPAPAR